MAVSAATTNNIWSSNSRIGSQKSMNSVTTKNWFSYGIASGRISVKSPAFYIASRFVNDDRNKCEVRVLGQGVNDTFDLGCDKNNLTTTISSGKYVLYENPDVLLTLFTDTPSSLVVIKNDKCTKRFYKTFRGKTTYYELSMDKRQCAIVKKKIEIVKRGRRRLWEQWKKIFYHTLKKKFPLCWTLYCLGFLVEREKSKFENNSIEDIIETNRNSLECWRLWQQEIEAEMIKRFSSRCSIWSQYDQDK